MKKEIKAEWVAALRSGRYPQTQGHLHQAGGRDEKPLGYCCLGVLCSIAERHGVVVSQYNPRSGFFAYGKDTETAVLPLEIAVWAGLTGPDPADPYVPWDEDEDTPLTALNDDYRQTFAQIADLIEEHL